MSIAPFKLDWDEAAVEAVLDKVRRYRFPPTVPGAGWRYGCDGDYLERLCRHWTSAYDWRAAQDRLNLYPQGLAPIEDQVVHFVHVRGEAKGRRPLLLTHGWPGSHYEFWDIIGPLAFPSQFDGRVEDAFDLVIPSLPGFGFSSKPGELLGQRRTARLFASLMSQLGYDSFLAQGGDWGGSVTSWLALDHAPAVKGIHLNMIGLRPTLGPQTPDELAWVKRTRSAVDALGAYQRLQATKPQSIAWAMADNPVGQAAWIVERFHDWSDLRQTPFEVLFPMDDLLTNIMIYVMSEAFTTAAWYYRARVEEEEARLAPGQRCETPTAFANFHGEPLYNPPPRSWAERAYNVVRWTDFESGGHFAAMEQPAALVGDLRAWAAQL